MANGKYCLNIASYVLRQTQWIVEISQRQALKKSDQVLLCILTVGLTSRLLQLQMVLLQLFCHCSQSHSLEGAGHVHLSAGVLLSAPQTVKKKIKFSLAKETPNSSSLVPGKQLSAPSITIY